MLSGAVGRAGRSPSTRCTPTSKPAKNARQASGTERGSRWYCANIWSMYSALARLTKSKDVGGAGGRDTVESGLTTVAPVYEAVIAVDYFEIAKPPSGRHCEGRQILDRLGADGNSGSSPTAAN